MYLFFSSKGIVYLSLPKEEEEDIVSQVKKYGVLQRVCAEEYKFHNQIIGYLKGQLKYFNLELDLRGTEFQRKVWNELLNIPYGETRTYKEMAKEVGSPRGFRAVGGALNKNPIPIIVPCHRVIGSNGELTGFAGGVRLKRRLLELEASNA
ncbi:cysteine methyltransferase [Clostridium sp. Cult3]|nr:cysteine methyltransferase [Clostridium sp. Cult3]